MYTPLEEAKKEVWKRWNDADLRQRVLAYAADLSEVLSKELMAIMFRQLATCMSGMLKKSDTAAFFFFSIKESAFVTMVYLRHGSYQYNGMSSRDWRILLASLAVANVYWTLAAYMGISVVEWVWKVVKSG